MKKLSTDYILVMIGLSMLGAGLYWVKTLVDPQGFWRTFPYICIGIGCGIFGHGMGNIISRKAMQSTPEIQKQIRIEAKDERNVEISNKAKAKAYDMMTFVFGALMMTFALMGVDVEAVLMLVSAYLFVHGYAIYYRCKYDKEM